MEVKPLEEEHKGPPNWYNLVEHRRRITSENRKNRVLKLQKLRNDKVSDGTEPVKIKKLTGRKRKRRNVDLSDSEVEKKKKRRKMKNREAAQKSRNKRKDHQKKVENELSDVKARFNVLQVENTTLKKRLGSCNCFKDVDLSKMNVNEEENSSNMDIQMPPLPALPSMVSNGQNHPPQMINLTIPNIVPPPPPGQFGSNEEKNK